MIQDIIDEVLESEPRYTLRDNAGNVLNDNVDIALKTPVVEEGTPINRALFRNLQGDLYTQDRYNTITGYEFVKTGEGTGNYWATNKAKSINVYLDDSSLSMATMLYSSSERTGGFQTATYDNIGRVTIQNYAPLKIKEIKIKGYGVSGQALNPKKFRIYGSNDGISWRLIYVNSDEIINTLTTLAINSTEFFDYIQLEFETNESNSMIQMQAFYVSSWEVGKHVLSLNTPLTSYERDKIVKIRGTSFKIQDSNYTETTFSNASVQPTFSNSNVATNEYGTWSVACNRIPISTTYPAWKVFDKDTNSYYQAQNMMGYTAYIELSSLETVGNTAWSIKPTSIYIYATQGLGSLTVKGYNVTTQRWEKFATYGSETFTEYNTSFSKTIAVSTTYFYSRFRIDFTAFSSSYSNPIIREFRVQTGTIRTGISSPIYINSFGSATYLNINNKGEKLINGSINYSNAYDLIYNGNNFDILSDDYVTGTYTGDSTARMGTQEIVLGYKPKLLIVGTQGANGQSGNNMEWFLSNDIMLGNNYDRGTWTNTAGYCELTNRGFIARNGTSIAGDNYGYNYNGVIYKYIVLK